ncbi:LINE-1 retrotransposable element ORF1 protein [Plecturocebus cupreus]
MLTRMDNLEKNINELMELKNTIREIREVCTSFTSQIDQVEERILEVEDQLNEMKQEDKIREKSIKRNEQNLQEIWDYMKRPNLCLIGMHDSEEYYDPQTQRLVWAGSCPSSSPHSLPPPSLLNSPSLRHMLNLAFDSPWAALTSRRGSEEVLILCPRTEP